MSDEKCGNQAKAVLKRSDHPELKASKALRGKCIVVEAFKFTLPIQSDGSITLKPMGGLVSPPKLRLIGE